LLNVMWGNDTIKTQMAYVQFQAWVEIVQYAESFKEQCISVQK